MKILSAIVLIALCTVPAFATLEVESGGGSSGDVTGPASSTDNAIVRFDGTTGKAVQGGTGAPVYDDTGNVGIGNTGPDTALHVLGGVCIDTDAVCTDPGAGAIDATTVLDAATGNEVAFTFNYTTNKATSGNDTGLLINQTDTASPGTSLLLDAQVGGVSKFNVRNDGVLRTASDFYITDFVSSNYVLIDTTGTYATMASGAFAFSSSSSNAGAGKDLSLVRNAAGVLKITDGSSGTGGLISALNTHTPSAVTCSAGAGKSALTITPTSSYVEITNSDADGCDITMGETGMTAGAVVTLCIVSNAGLTVDFADTPGVTELAGAFAANIDDCITLRYGNTTTWREVSRSAN